MAFNLPLFSGLSNSSDGALAGRLIERLVGRGEDGEGTIALQRVHEVGGLDGGDEGLELGAASRPRCPTMSFSAAKAGSSREQDEHRSEHLAHWCTHFSVGLDQLVTGRCSHGEASSGRRSRSGGHVPWKRPRTLPTWLRERRGLASQAEAVRERTCRSRGRAEIPSTHRQLRPESMSSARSLSGSLIAWNRVKRVSSSETAGRAAERIRCMDSGCDVMFGRSRFRLLDLVVRFVPDSGRVHEDGAV